VTRRPDWLLVVVAFAVLVLLVAVGGMMWR